MAFTSLLFIFFFLPVSYLLIRYIPQIRWKNLILLILSWIFYGWGSIISLCILILITVFNYLSGLQMNLPTSDEKKRKIILWTAIVFNLLVLCFYKYLTVWFSYLGIGVLSNIPTPAGLSFYVFTTISYIADVYMRKVPAQKNFISLALYISFFGKLIMGPISKYRDFESALSNRTMDWSSLTRGVNLFFIGLVKKVLLADTFAVVFAALSQDSSFLGAWLLALAYTFQLYFDFSGYSDMAIGVGYMFGFKIPANFNHPYAAVSVQDFWRRWHISLSSWFRDYVYIPLGGSRCSTKDYIRNILVVWMLTGIWHGAQLTFVAWGLYYGLLLLAQKFWFQKISDRLPTALNIVITFLIVVVGWIFFSSPTLSIAFGHLGNMVGIGISSFASWQSLFYLSSYWLPLLLAFVFSFPVYETVTNLIYYRFKTKAILPMTILKICIFMCITATLVSSTAQTFLYNAF